jgi:hypothetical protein
LEGCNAVRLAPLFAERVVIGLSPAEISIEATRLACDPAFGSEPWHGALEALKSVEITRRSRVSIILSNHFVRYALVPWSDALATPAEEEAYVRHHFAKVHGERAKEWVLRSSQGARSAPRLASAIDRGLLEGIRAALPKGGKAKLVSVQPQLMSIFNQWRRSIPSSGAWLVMAEPERACVALHAAGAWRTVLNGKGPWRALLDRERHRVDGELPDLVLLAGASAPEQDSEWKFRELAA